MFQSLLPRFLLSAFVALATGTWSTLAQSFEIFEPAGKSTAGLDATSAVKVSADGTAVIGNTSATGVGALEYPPFIWRADTGMFVITNLPSPAGQLTGVDVADGGNRAVLMLGNAEAFLWTRTNGLQSTGRLTDGPNKEVRPSAISADGKVILGRARSANTTAIIPPTTYQMWEAFRWTAETGMVGLGDIMGDPARDVFDSEAIGVSGNGQIIVGRVRYGGPVPLSPNGYYAAARWIAGVGPQMLPVPPEFKEHLFADAISANGTFIVGHYEFGGEIIPGGGGFDVEFTHTYRWSESLGYTILFSDSNAEGFGSSFAPTGISHDGLVVVGRLNSHDESNPVGAAIWTPDRGVRLLSDVLIGLGVNPGAFILGYALNVSADGRVIVGNGTDRNGKTRGYRAVLAPPRKTIVNVASDDDDANPNDGVVDVDLNTPGEQVSLRAAINYANNTPGRDTIEFDVAGGGPITISPTNSLPPITEALTIDGNTQPGSERVGLNGALAGAAADGLRLVGTNCVIKGLVVTRFSGAGLKIDGGFGHTIVGNIFGTDAAGSAGLGNGIGLQVMNSASNAIGGFQVTTRNVFSGNASAGVFLTNCSEIDMRANLVGTDLSGTLNRPNGQFGFIANKIKRLTMGVASALSVYNSPSAIELQDIGEGAGTSGGSIINSYIGLSSSGTAGLGGTINGLSLSNAVDFEIGGTSRNIFAGIVSNAIAVVNSSNVNVTANYIGTSSSGNVNLPVGTGIFAQAFKKLAIGLTNVLTVINGQNGVILRDANGIGSATGTNASMVNCNIGLDANGTTALGGTETGLRLEGVSGVDIGGAARNVFAGISSNAITVLNATNINILANHLGTARSGNISIPVGFGIVADKVRNLIIGMTNQLTVINARQAVVLTEVTGTISGENSSSQMINCHVGLNSIGNTNFAAVTNGIRIERSSGFKIGGPVRNVFAGIVSNAVSLVDSTNIQVTGNYIGTSSSGSVSLPVGTGIWANKVRDLVIGMSNQLSVINGRAAVTLTEVTGSGSGGGGSRMDNCHVGVNAAGTAALAATTNGVQIFNSSGFILGGIARNVLAGIRSNAVTVLNSTNIHVAANYIGTSSSGSASLPVGLGIMADKARNLVIGMSNQLSVINAQSAVVLSGISGSGSGGGGSSMDNCYVGVNAAGTAALAATTNGVQVFNSSGFILGGIARNVLGGIASNALTVINSTNTRVLSGYFGTDHTGSNRVANGGNNITVVSSQNFTVGRETAGKVSVVLSGANQHGIEATDSPGLRITHSAFGTDSGGGKAVSNLLSSIKVHCSAAFAAQAGADTTVIASNSIAFSGGAGVEFAQQDVAQFLTALQHRMLSNAIAYNRSHGVSLGSNVSSVTIGGTNLSEANQITQNGGSGVHMTSPGDYNFVELNSMYSNVVKAITRVFDAKHQIQMQVISAIRGSTHVKGNVNGRPNETVRLHFYAHRPKAGAQGEGEMWVGSVNVPLDGSGVGSYDSRLPRTAPNGWLVASTGADSVLGTSEFSNSLMVQNPTDTDGDGLPDFWEALYPSCLDPLVADLPNEDCDGDGFTNLQEYIAHTDPTQANSALKVENLETDGKGATLKFTGVAGRQYGLERRISLSGGPWVRIITAIPEADGLVVLTDPNPPAGNAYYRLVAELP